MAEPSFLTAVRESYDTVAADYVGCGRPVWGRSRTWGAAPDG